MHRISRYHLVAVRARCVMKRGVGVRLKDLPRETKHALTHQSPSLSVRNPPFPLPPSFRRFEYRMKIPLHLTSGSIGRVSCFALLAALVGCSATPTPSPTPSNNGTGGSGSTNSS